MVYLGKIVAYEQCDIGKDSRECFNGGAKGEEIRSERRDVQEQLSTNFRLGNAIACKKSGR